MIINSHNHLTNKTFTPLKNNYFKGNDDLTIQKPITPEKSRETNTKNQTIKIIIVSIAAFLLGIKSVKTFSKKGIFIPRKLLPNELKIIKKLETKGLSPELAKIFSQIKHIKCRKEFCRQALKLIGKQQGYKERTIPNLIFFKMKNAANLGDAGYTPFPSAIAVNLDNNNLIPLSKVRLINLIRHEFKHFEQVADILRTEGLGHIHLIKAEMEKYYKNCHNNPILCKHIFNKSPEFLSEKDIHTFFYEKLSAQRTAALEKMLIEDMGIISAQSERGKIAKSYLPATKNYVTPVDTGNIELNNELIKQYRANLLETEAYKAGNWIQTLYEEFIIELALSKKS